MGNKMKERLVALRAEFDSGQKVLAELEAKQASIRNTMLRISGAIQVLEELLAQEQRDNHKGDASECDEETRVAFA